MLDDKEEIEFRKKVDGHVVCFCLAFFWFIGGITACILGCFAIIDGFILGGIGAQLICIIFITIAIVMFRDWCRANPNNLFSIVKKQWCYDMEKQ